jgi:REP element-mobilizing transposase RayT
MAYWRLFYHLVWATHQRLPLITPELEPAIYDLLRTKAIGLDATVFAINGMEDHVHCVAAIPPSLAVANFVGQIKGVASVKVNRQLFVTGRRFSWQESYGVFSFDAKRLPYVVEYVEKQKQHHRGQGLIPILERTEDSPVQLLREESAIYLAGIDDWRAEMLALEPAGEPDVTQS